jgi:hypothetical protein
MHHDSGRKDVSNAGRLAGVTWSDDRLAVPSPQVGMYSSSLPQLALPSKHRSSRPPAKIPMPHSGDNNFTSVEMVSHPGIHTERFQIADKLSRARPDLVSPSYAPKRAEQSLWNMRSKVQEQYQDGLRSLFHVTMADTSAEAAALECDLTSKDQLENDDSSMDWDRSRELRDTVLAQLGKGEPVLLPGLACLNSQF